MGKVVIKRERNSGQHTVVVERYGYHHRYVQVSESAIKQLYRILHSFPQRAVISTNHHVETTIYV